MTPRDEALAVALAAYDAARAASIEAYNERLEAFFKAYDEADAIYNTELDRINKEYPQ